MGAGSAARGKRMPFDFGYWGMALFITLPRPVRGGWRRKSALSTRLTEVKRDFRAADEPTVIGERTSSQHQCRSW